MQRANQGQVPILVAEDDQTLGYFLRRHLEQEGYHPTIVESGDDVMRMATTLQPEVIVLDIDLPGTDGFTVCRQLKHDPRTADIPIIFLTGQTDISDRVAGLDAGAQDYLTKPFALTEFQARLRAIIRTSEEAARARLEAGEREGQFLRIINDTLRNPLAVISMATQILSESQQISEERRRQLMQSIRDSVSELTHIIDDLLYLAHPTRYLRAFNPRSAIQNAVDDSRENALEHDLRLLVRMPPELPQMVADETQLRRSLHHLIDNAIKFTPRGGVITITVAVVQRGEIVASEPDAEYDIVSAIPTDLVPQQDEQPWLLIIVRDTGIGIDPEHHQRVFEPFFQVDSSTARTAQGLGLGLAVVAAFVRAHRGHLAVRSGNGLGTAVHLALPLQAIVDDIPDEDPASDGPVGA
jgi:signal transduction histidine kinase